jgi:membrane peptidoglycan carboxypeptidase
VAKSGDHRTNAIHGFGLSLDDSPESRRRRAGLPNGSRAPIRTNGSNNPGVGAAQAAARAELRRRRASAYRHLRTPRKRGRVLRIVLIAITVFAAIGAGTVGAVFAGYSAYKSQLPSAATITDMEPEIDTDVYDSTGGLIHVFHNQDYRHVHVDLPQISPYFKEAIVAIEDHNFYTEGSWDLARLVESGVADVTHHGASLQGGSTITEQLAKISLYGGADPPQSIDYKIKEIVLGNEIALNFTKAQILDMYVNRIYYGNFALGVGSAAEMYFEKPASQLDLAQAAMLAGLPQSPSAYNPLIHSTNEVVNPLAKSRQKAVLQAMQASGYITQAEGIAAYNEKLTIDSYKVSEPPATFDLDFVDYLESYLNESFPQYVSPGGYNIYTTLDQTKQNLGQGIVSSVVAKERIKENMGDGALVSLDPQNGEVLAMIGSWNYNDPYFGDYNYAATAQLNMGSTTKLFTYTTAIASTKFTMTTPILDDYYPFPIVGSAPYKPFDDDRRTHGVCELKLCLGNSLNIPAVKTEYATGTQYIANTELSMGVSSLEQNCGTDDQSVNWPSTDQWAATLGSLTCGITLLDLADGAATLGDLGVQHNPMPVTRITAAETGDAVWTYNPAAAGRQVIPANVAFIMDEITSNDSNRYLEFGRNGPLTLNPRRVSAKTGTAEFYLDNLTVGWTPNLITAVWVGNEQQSCLQAKDYKYMAAQIAKGNTFDDDQASPGATYPFSPHDLAHYGLQPAHPSTPDCGHLDGVISGYSGAAPIWHAYMEAALKGVPDTWYQPPPDLITVSTGQGFDDSNFYLPGTGPDAPAGQCTYYGPTPLPTSALPPAEQLCTYAGPSAAPPPPTTSPSPSPSPGGNPTPSPSPSPT